MEKIFSGKYEMQGEIARGGMGAIFKAVHTTLNRSVAIKILHPQFSGDPAFHKRFQREARAMARLDHENIIRVFDVSEDKGSHYIVMEFFDGKDLKHLILERGKLAVHEALAIAYQMASALSYAHSQGVIHRDIKPGNIMIDRFMRVKIADFGIAAATDEISVTATGQIIGTPEYMSPEQARGENLDGRSDLYSLGTVIYEMITGRTPYEGISRMAIVGKLVYEQEELSLSFPEDVPPAVQQLVRSLMRKQPENRVQSAQALMTQLEQLGIDFRGAGRSTSPISRDSSATLAAAEEDGPTVMLHETPAFTPPPRPPTVPAAPPRSTPVPQPIPVRETQEPPVRVQTPRPVPRPVPRTRSFVPLIVGGVSAILLAGGAIYYFTSMRDTPASVPEPVQKAETPSAPSVAETELREILRSIREMQDQVSTARAEADTVGAERHAPKIYQQAVNDESVGSQALQEGSNLINLKQYEAAQGSLQEALTLLTQARDSFVQSREAAASKTAEEERLRKIRAEAERLKKSRAEAEKTAKAVTSDRPDKPPAPSPSAKTAVKQAPSSAQQDIQVIGGILTEFKRNYESRDLQALKRTSEMSEGRARFLEQVFQNYSSINTTIADLSLTGESASAVILITKLVDREGNTVSPGDAWKRTKVIIKKQGNQWGKVIW